MTLAITGHILLALLSCQQAVGQRVDHQQGEEISAQQWNVLDIKFPAQIPAATAIDSDFSAVLTHQDSGQSLEIAGFFNGGDQFLLRFTPPKSGQWKYLTRSSVEALDGRSAAIKVDPAAEGRKGGIVIDPKLPTRFRYQSGDCYYPIAYEVDWLFALDAENADDIPLSKKTIDSMADNGFNQVVMNVFAYDVKWEKDKTLDSKFDFGSPQVFPFGGDNNSPDHTTLNIEYFQRLDRVIDYLDQKGIAAHLMIYVWNKRVNWPAAGSKEDNRYFEYVAKRYQAYPNIIWDISKEALGYGHDDVNYISERIERLRKIDSYDRLITVHDYFYCRRFTDNIDFVSVQLWQSELYSVMRNVVDQMPKKPVLNIEHGGYERSPYVVFNGNYTSPEVCLERAYQCVFAGTYPTHYWQGAAWNVIVPQIESLPPEDQPRLDYYRHMRTLIEKYDVDSLIAGEKHSNAGFVLHDGKNLYIYYVPKECDFFGLRMPKEARGKMMKQQWFDPFEGTFGDIKKSKVEQWPKVKTPDKKGFKILIVNVEP